MKEELAKCIGCKITRCNACPCDTDVGGIIRLVKEGKIEEAGKILFDNNPLSAITSAICPNHDFCGKGCVLSRAGKAVNFARIEYEISNQYLDKLLKTATKIPPQENAKNIAIIGAGSAGLAYGFYAIHGGHHVSIFEKENNIGGMLRYGIPTKRFDKSVIDKIENLLKAFGVKIYTNTEFLNSKDYFDEIIVATGACESKKLDLNGEEKFTIGAINFLRDINSTKPNFKDKNVVVIGGGNVAVDCAIAAMDAGATAMLFYRKSEEFLKAGIKEIDLAKQMGIKLNFNHVPVSFKKYIATFDYHGQIKETKADIIVMAIGQNTTKPEISNAHYIGDCVTGTKTVIEAVAGAKKLFKELNPTIEFRLVTLDDFKDFSETHKSVFIDCYTGFLPQEFIEQRCKQYSDEKWFKEKMQSEDSQAYICYVNGKPMGCVAFGKLRDKDATKTDGEIWSLNFKKESHGKGYAKKAMEFAEQNLRDIGFKTIYLWCLADNKHARNFYENKNGYTPTDVTKDQILAGIPFKEIRFIKSN